MRNLKKALCGIMTGMMIITAAPVAIPGTGFVTEVQAATIGTPKMVSVKAVGKSTVAVKWSAVKGAAGYRVMRKTNSGRWGKPERYCRSQQGFLFRYEGQRRK